MNMMRRFISLLLTVIMLLAAIPALAALTDDVLADVIIEDTLESYEAGYIPNGIIGWGSNIDKPVTVQELDGNKAIRYRNIGNYGQFTAGKGYTGRLWATVSVLLPKDYTDFRVQFKNAGTPAYPLCELHLVKTADGVATLRGRGIIAADGSTYQPYISQDVVTGAYTDSGDYASAWVELRVLFDTDSQTVEVYVNGERKGETYDFCYKNLAEEDVNKKNTALMRIDFANRALPAGVTEADFYLDNFGIYYSRDLSTQTGYIERNVIIDTYDDYELPYIMELPVDGSQTRPFEIKEWEPQGEAIDFSNKQEGTYVYHGYIDKSERYVRYTVEIKSRYITEIPDVYASTYQFASYSLPATVEVIMSDGNKKQVAVIWDEDTVDTSQTGVVNISGRVEGMSDRDVTTEVTIHVGITVYPVKEIEDVYIGIPVGTEGFTLPDRVTAKLEDNSKQEVAVTWDGAAPDTSVPGVYTYTGTAAGYLKKIKLQLTVYAENADDENIYKALIEYYGHCLNEGRDRTRYGYSESAPNPIFAAGINRLTGKHSMWSFEKEGETPLTDLASQTCLVKGLMGMSEIMDGETALIQEAGIPSESYREAVYDAYRYYLENYYDEKNFMMMWGGHTAVNMETYEPDLRLATHEVKDHYPLFDVMYDIDPEKTEKYIKALWTGHVKDTTNLQFSRHFNTDNAQDSDTVDNIFDTIQLSFNENQQPFFDAKDGLLTFITAGNDFIFAAGELYRLNGDENALNAAVNLQSMFLKGRHTGKHPLTGEETSKEATGLIPFLFTESPILREPIYDVWAPEYTNGGFGTSELKNRMQFNLYDLVYADPDYPDGNPYISDFGMSYDATVDITIYCYNPMVMFRIAESCDEATRKYLIEEAIKTLAAFVRVKYDPTKHQGKPMLLDGTELTGYAPKRSGYAKLVGVTFEPWVLEADYILGFIRGYLNAISYGEMQEDAETIWSAVRNSFDYYGVGDVGTAPGENMQLNFDTDCEQPFVLISLCELYNQVKEEAYLELARVVANNILNNRFVDGYFYEKPDMLHANFNTEEPYALVYFLATTKGIAQNIPEHFGSRGFFQFDWWEEHTQQNKKLYSNKLWSLTMTGEVLATGIELNTNSLELAPGEKYTLSASIEPENTEDKTVEYKSSDKDVCIVNEDGVITAVSQGEATVTATAVSGGCEATVTVKVK